MGIGNTRLMRKMNMNLLRNIMKQKRTFKKAELARESGLSVVTINALLTEFIEAGEVIETDNLATTGGRKATLYQYNAQYKLVMTVCLFERNQQEAIHLSVCNLLGETIFEAEFVFLAIEFDQFEQLIEAHFKKYPNISVISIGIPGLEKNGFVKIIDFKGLCGKNLRKNFELKFNIPVLIENDVNAAISGYYLGLEQEVNSIIGIYYPMNHPPGAGVVLNGALLKGKNGMVGEFKYLPFGTGWDHFSFQKEALKQHALKTIIAIGSLYDPEQYVLYGEIFDEDFVYQIEKELLETFPSIERPTLICETDFHQDYLNGVIALSLDYLNRENA